MPTYDYRCTKCGHEFEVFQKITARTRARKCLECGGRAERQISGGAGLLFKGEGFYITDYRSAEYKSKADADSKSGGSKDKGSSSTKEKGGRASSGGEKSSSET